MSTSDGRCDPAELDLGEPGIILADSQAQLTADPGPPERPPGLRSS